MEKTAENCGGRSGPRSPDLLGVNGRDGRQVRHLAQTAKRDFRRNGTFRSACVPDLGTDRTEVVTLTDEEMNRIWGGVGPLPPPKYRKPPAGHIVYFVGGETGPVKIGFTQQPMKARLVCIQNGSPVKLHVLATVPAFRQREKMYHREFAAFRLHGEWFERTPEIEAEIARLNARTE